MNNTEKRVQLGDRGRMASVSSFQGYALFHLRRYFWSEEKNMFIPTRHGLTLNFSEFVKLKDSLLYLEEEFKKLEANGVQLEKNVNQY